MHRKHRHANVYRVDIAVRHILGQRFRRRPGPPCQARRSATAHPPGRQNICHIASVSRGASFVPSLPREPVYFVTHHTTVHASGIAWVQHVRERGVERRVHIRRHAYCMLEHHFIICALCVAPVPQEVEQRNRPQARGAVRAHLFLICQIHTVVNAGAFASSSALQRRIGAHTVIMAIGAIMLRSKPTSDALTPEPPQSPRG